MGRRGGIHVLAATRPDQLAAELDKLGHGVFTASFLRGVQGSADTRPHDQIVSVKELMAFAEDYLPRMTRQFLPDPQMPVAYSHGADFMVAQVGESAPAPAAAPSPGPADPPRRGRKGS